MAEIDTLLMTETAEKSYPWGRTYLYSRTASCVSFVRKSAWKNEKNIGYDPPVTSSARAGRALKIGSPVFDFFFFTLYFIFTHFLYKTEGPDGVQMDGGGGGRIGEGGATTFCTRSINQFGLYIHKLIAKTLD